MGWSPGDKIRRFTPAEDKAIRDGRASRLYWHEIADQLDRSTDAVKRRGRLIGAILAPRPGPRPNIKPAAPDVPDADLVAAYLATKKVTLCPPGLSAGLSQIERELHAAPAAANGDWRKRIHNDIQAQKRRK